MVSNLFRNEVSTILGNWILGKPVMGAERGKVNPKGKGNSGRNVFKSAEVSETDDDDNDDEAM